MPDETRMLFTVHPRRREGPRPLCPSVRTEPDGVSVCTVEQVAALFDWTPERLVVLWNDWYGPNAGEVTDELERLSVAGDRKGTPTSAELEKLVVASLADPRVSEAMKVLRQATYTVPFTAVVLAMLWQFDGLALGKKLEAITAFLDFDHENLQSDAIGMNYRAWHGDMFRLPTT